MNDNEQIDIKKIMMKTNELEQQMKLITKVLQNEIDNLYDHIYSGVLSAISVVGIIMLIPAVLALVTSIKQQNGWFVILNNSISVFAYVTIVCGTNYALHILRKLRKRRKNEPSIIDIINRVDQQKVR